MIKKLFIAAGLVAFVACSRHEVASVPSLVKWQSSYQQALAQAKSEKKLVMVDIYTDWCGWCKRLDKDVYANAAVAEALAKHFIPVKVNPEKSREGAELAKKFGTQGFPHIVFVNGNGEKVAEISGYLPPTDFIGQLASAAQKL